MNSTRRYADAVSFGQFGLKVFQSKRRYYGEQGVQIPDQKTKSISQLANGFGVPNCRLGLRTGHKQK
jgi:hypothetical protein